MNKRPAASRAACHQLNQLMGKRVGKIGFEERAQKQQELFQRAKKKMQWRQRQEERKKVEEVHDSSIGCQQALAELGVDESANTTTIKAAFRELAKVWHPDRRGGDKARFQRINNAYKTIMLLQQHDDDA